MNPMHHSQLANCPCGKKDSATEKALSYQDCCQRLHSQTKIASNALELMRSRYCAYVCGLSNYIIDTTDTQSPLYESDRKKWQQEIECFCKSNQFLGLTILSTQLEDDRRQTVEFEAKIIQFGNDPFSIATVQSTRSMHEKSLFCKRNGLWLYHSPLSLEFA